MTLGFWEPFRELDTIDRVVGNLFGRDARDAWERAQSSRTHRLAADLAADKDGYVFRFDVPGVPKDAISISMEDNVLTVSGERTESFSGKNDDSTVYRREIVSGQFGACARAAEIPQLRAISTVKARLIRLRPSSGWGTGGEVAGRSTCTSRAGGPPADSVASSRSDLRQYIILGGLRMARMAVLRAQPGP